MDPGGAYHPPIRKINQATVFAQSHGLFSLPSFSSYLGYIKQNIPRHSMYGRKKPTKLGSLGNKCRSIGHTLSIWDSVDVDGSENPAGSNPWLTFH